VFTIYIVQNMAVLLQTDITPLSIFRFSNKNEFSYKKNSFVQTHVTQKKIKLSIIIPCNNRKCNVSHLQETKNKSLCQELRMFGL
jgi:hypothetical protein